MSESLDLVRSMYADWERGDLSRVDWADPEIELVITDGVEPGVWRGLDGMRDQVRGTLSEMKDWREGAEEYRELADGRVLALSRFTGRGRTSGLDVGAPVARVFEIRAGRVTRMTVYWSRDRALADLGLKE